VRWGRCVVTGCRNNTGCRNITVARIIQVTGIADRVGGSGEGCVVTGIKQVIGIAGRISRQNWWKWGGCVVTGIKQVIGIAGRISRQNWWKWGGCVVTAEKGKCRHMHTVGQNPIYTPYITVHFVVSLPRMLYIHHL
jgi:hypothetical protein